MHGCEVVPSVEEIKGIIDDDVYRKYVRFKNQTKVAKDKNLILCGQASCDEVLDIRKAENVKHGRKVNCSTCGEDTCVACKKPWHNSACVSEAKEYAKAFEGIKFYYCPKCHSPIEKDGGCSMMECSVCNYKWCWICGHREMSFIHIFQAQILCQLINGIIGEWKTHIIIRILTCIVLYILSPILLLLVAILVPFFLVILETS